jgi:hypothetical protein
MLPAVIMHSLVTVAGKIERFSPESGGLYYRLADRLDCDTWLRFRVRMESTDLRE